MKPIIVGIADTTLNADEIAYIKTHDPAGFILFARNCESPEQVTALTAALRDASGRDQLLILIDQEGGRVARLRPPHWRDAPPAALFAGIAEQEPGRAEELVRLNAGLMASELLELGITGDCVPVADIPAPESHDIIGDRAFGTTPEQVSHLAGVQADAMLAAGVLPVVKHIPGHGRSLADSHEELPVVGASLKELRQVDFVPFKDLAKLPLGMTAHIRYTAIDPDAPATLSPKAIALIRDEIGFSGILMSDDIAMKALSGSMGEIACNVLAAGCDLVLHCNGEMAEMQAIADAVAPMDAQAEARFDAIWQSVASAKQPQKHALLGAYEQLLSA